MKKLLALALILLTVVPLVACANARFLAVPPYLPLDCYNCVEATPSELVSAYYSSYSNISLAQQFYNDKYYVFKNIVLTDWMTKDSAQGSFLLPSNIQCTLADAGNLKRFKLGDKVDVVGYNAGIIALSMAGLKFKDCYILPAGSVQLPLGGNSAAFGPAY